MKRFPFGEYMLRPFGEVFSSKSRGMGIKRFVYRVLVVRGHSLMLQAIVRLLRVACDVSTSFFLL